MAGESGTWRERSVLVTGGAGFIGSHLVDALVAAGARVTVLDDLSTGCRENLARPLAAGQATLIEGDLRERQDCQRALAAAAAGGPVAMVFHQAALGSVPRSLDDPATTVAVNATGTAQLFTAVRDAGIRRIVYASSSSVFGDSEQLPKREGEEGRPLSPYALSKSMGEGLADLFARAFGMAFVGLRYFNVYGPRQSPQGPYAAVIPRFFAACRTGQATVIYGDGEQSRDFTYVADAVAANLAAATYLLENKGYKQVGGTCPVVNIGGGQAYTINQLAAAVRRVCGGGPDPVYEPARAGDMRASLADLSRAGELFGYRPTVSLEEGLRRIAEAEV